MLTATSGYNMLPGNTCPGVNAALMMGVSVIVSFYFCLIKSGDVRQ